MRTSDRRTHAYISFHEAAFLNVAHIDPINLYNLCLDARKVSRDWLVVQVELYKAVFR